MQQRIPNFGIPDVSPVLAPDPLRSKGTESRPSGRQASTHILKDNDYKLTSARYNL